MPAYASAPQSDTVDVADVMRTLRRQWRGIVAFLALGVFGALAVVLFAPRRYEGKASVLARPGAGSGGSILGRLGNGGIGELIGNVAGMGGTRTDFETELQVLKSRDLTGRLVDSLKLQFSPRAPRGVAATSYVAASQLQPSFEPRVYVFQRTPNGAYRTEHEGKTYELTPGQPSALDIGTLTLASGPLPPSFGLKVFDREDAITRVGNRLRITKAGGDVAQIVFSGDDSISAAAAPNALVAFYLERRRTVDRGVNQRRVEYVTAQMDSTAALLGATERALRQYQERSGILDAELVGKAQWDGAVQLRKSLTDVEVDAAAINQLLAQANAGTLTHRQLAAYPTFLRGSSISPMITQLGELDAARIKLLERRTEKDPEVIALDQSIAATEDQILSMARSYANAVNKQRAEMAAQLDSLQHSLTALPAAAEQGGRLQRDVLRLTQIYGALQAQLVEARLGAIGEGGEIKPLDLAVAPRKPSFPEPFLTMGIGTAGGLLAGIVAALFLGWFGRWLRDPVEVERLAGVTAQRFQADAPLLLLGKGSARSVLVVPLDGARTGLVAERLARTATARAVSATVLDLSSDSASNGNGQSHYTVSGPAIEDLERQFGLVIVQLPPLSSEATLAALNEARPVLLVAPNRVDRGRLSSALEMLRRMDVPCAGVVIGDGQITARARALI